MNRARILPTFVVALGLALAPGLALADPGNGKGSGITNNPNVPPAQSSQDTTVPQPPSNADFTGNGANTHGPYDSTRDGSPSMNGNGGGEAVGKPCAGCVGKADNKNPPGQLPGGSDANSGYECDTNHGVGRTNPAHTGCVPQTPPGENPPGENPPGETPPGDTPPAQPPAGAAPVVPSQAADELAFTGFDALPAGLAGLVLVGAGGALLVTGRLSRTRRATDRR